jgi:hypothetical protein
LVFGTAALVALSLLLWKRFQRILSFVIGMELVGGMLEISNVKMLEQRDIRRQSGES